MASKGFDYIHMVEDALRKGVVNRALVEVRDNGFSGDHHFFISFDTTHPEVHIPDSLRDRFPEEMTIVIQHQFWDLQVEDEYFSIMLSFNNLPQRLVIPFEALTAFADPSVKFALQFTPKKATPKKKTALKPATTSSALPSTKLTTEGDAKPTVTTEEGPNVISFDRFRK